MDLTFVFGVISTVLPALGVIYGGYWLDPSDISPSRYSHVIRWCFIGLLSFTVLNIGFIATVPIPVDGIIAWVRWAVALGAGLGLLFGITEARAIEQAIAAERAAVRSEQIQDQRDMLDYLNSVLRHEVLNSANVIGGYARNVRETEDLSESGEEWVEIIRKESAEMGSVITDVRVLLEATSDHHELHQVNLTDVLRAEVTKVTNRYDSVSVEASIPDGVSVRGDALLARVFGNLLSNAVKHNDEPVPCITVSVEQSPETVRIQIEDNGSGIPDEKVDSLFEREQGRGTTHGLGLYLVDELVTKYDGAVELTETGADGSLFTVELPRMTADET